MLTQKQITRHIVEAIMDLKHASFYAPLGASNRHIHLNQVVADILFGPGYVLNQLKPLPQPGNFVAKETILVAGPKGSIPRVRVLGPIRSMTQLELLRSDGFVLGIDVPVRDSGCASPSPSVTLIGPNGSVTLMKGVLAAWRHIHLSENEASKYGLKDGDLVKIKSKGNRAVIFDNVKVRIGDFIPEVHMDIDEVNASGMVNGELLEIILA